MSRFLCEISQGWKKYEYESYPVSNIGQGWKKHDYECEYDYEYECEQIVA